MNLSPTALEALRAAQQAFSTAEADVFEDALARGLEAVDREGRLVGAHSAEELLRLRAEQDRMAALEALVATASEFRLWEPGYGLYVRQRPGGKGFAILEANRTSRGRRAWTVSGWRYVGLLAGEELFCWPDAESAVAEARRVMPGVPADEITAVVAPLSVLREVPDGEHRKWTHHDYRPGMGRDLPEAGGR
ncbi:hypothetical protein ACFWPQ_02145 [Streptomyces sp. NPDC058464]|uniref:hypothetical protein n=1 Tax=Streptomyces sp. NPDC058464 TaxID=3346511 RepID=UPI00364EB2D3